MTATGAAARASAMTAAKPRIVNTSLGVSTPRAERVGDQVAAEVATHLVGD